MDELNYYLYIISSAGMVILVLILYHVLKHRFILYKNKFSYRKPSLNKNLQLWTNLNLDFTIFTFRIYEY